MNHTRIAAWLHLLLSLMLAGAVVWCWMLAAELAEALSGTTIPELVAFFGKPIAIAALVVAVVELLAAGALLAGTRMRWPRFALATIGVLQLWAFPVGTGIGLYTYWALFRSPQPPPNVPPLLSPR